MTLQHVDILFQLIVFLFAISVHESAHAWMANRCGDPTAPMLCRITLNPIKHIDPFGTMLMPLFLFSYDLMVINIVLGVFNLIPVPPLDGSHVLRHFLPDPVRRAYDMMGWIGLLILVYFGGGLLGRLIFPVIAVFDRILIKL